MTTDYVMQDGRLLSEVKSSGAIKHIRHYLNDLREFYDEKDEGRFQRMIGAGGKGFDNAHPNGWVNAICNISERASQYHADELIVIAQTLTRWGHKCFFNGQRIEKGEQVAIEIVPVDEHEDFDSEIEE